MPDRYHSLTIMLHWVMAVAFVLMFVSGLSMVFLTLVPAFKFNLYQWHKSLGVVLMAAFALRLLVRLLTTAPAMPAHFARWEKLAAKIAHVGLYGLMIAMPISGWVMVSASVYGLPTIVFGLFEFPHVPNVAGDAAVEAWAKTTHGLLAIAFGLMIALHVAAVIKHAVIDHDNLLRRMIWQRTRK